MNEQILTYQEVLTHLRDWPETWSADRFRFLEKKHKIQGESLDGTRLWDLRLPLPMPPMTGAEESVDTYLQQLTDEVPTYLLVLVQMGAAALGYVENGEMVVHKSIKKYMKRHKRGKAQISYLNTRGKSKAGSRIRLANTVRFFEEINEKMTEWEEWYEPERIIYSCTAQLWGLMFQSKVPPPFEKKDPRLIKVPKDVHIPSYEELLEINEFVQCGLWQRAT